MRIFLIVIALSFFGVNPSILAQEQFVSMQVTSGNNTAGNDQEIALDRISAKVMPYNFRNVGGKFIGEGTSEGLENPCIVRFRFRSKSSKDSLELQMDKSGPLTAATYDIVPGNAPEKVQGKFIGGFGLAAAGEKSGAKPFRVKSGSLTIEEIAGEVITGHLSIDGAPGPVSYNEKSVTQAPTIKARFSIKAGGIAGPYRDQPFACLGS